MLRQLRYFQSVVRNNSFSEAAEECHISQSAISQQIQALRDCLTSRYPRDSYILTDKLTISFFKKQEDIR